MATTEKRIVTFCVIESPYAPFTKSDPGLADIELARNEAYVNACMADAFARGEVPFASHAIYTRNTHGVKVLDDTIPEERKRGMQAGFDVAVALALFAEWSGARLGGGAYPFKSVKFTRAFYHDRGWTTGMADGMLEAGVNHQTISKRTLGDCWTREHDKDYVLDSHGHLYKWRNTERLDAQDVTRSPLCDKYSGTTTSEVKLS